MQQVNIEQDAEQIEAFYQRVNAMRNTDNKDAVLFIGPTGAGKSTLINLLLGHQFREQVRRRRVFLEPQMGEGAPAQAARVGAYNSETTYPSAFDVDDDTCLVDLAGLFDTRGDVARMNCQFGIGLALKMLRSVKQIVVVLPYKTLDYDGDHRGRTLREVAQFLFRALERLADYENNVVFVVNKLPDNLRGANQEARLQALRDEIDDCYRSFEEGGDAERAQQLCGMMLAACETGRLFGLYRDDFVQVERARAIRHDILQSLQAAEQNIPTEEVTFGETVPLAPQYSEYFMGLRANTQAILHAIRQHAQHYAVMDADIRQRERRIGQLVDENAERAAQVDAIRAQMGEVENEAMAAEQALRARQANLATEVAQDALIQGQIRENTQRIEREFQLRREALQEGHQHHVAEVTAEYQARRNALQDQLAGIHQQIGANEAAIANLQREWEEARNQIDTIPGQREQAVAEEDQRHARVMQEIAEHYETQLRERLGQLEQQFGPQLHLLENTVRQLQELLHQQEAQREHVRHQLRDRQRKRAKIHRKLDKMRSKVKKKNQERNEVKAKFCAQPFMSHWSESQLRQALPTYNNLCNDIAALENDIKHVERDDIRVTQELAVSEQLVRQSTETLESTRALHRTKMTEQHEVHRRWDDLKNALVDRTNAAKQEDHFEERANHHAVLQRITERFDGLLERYQRRVEQNPERIGELRIQIIQLTQAQQLVRAEMEANDLQHQAQMRAVQADYEADQQALTAAQQEAVAHMTARITQEYIQRVTGEIDREIEQLQERTGIQLEGLRNNQTLIERAIAVCEEQVAAAEADLQEPLGQRRQAHLAFTQAKEAYLANEGALDQFVGLYELLSHVYTEFQREYAPFVEAIRNVEMPDIPDFAERANPAAEPAAQARRPAYPGAFFHQARRPDAAAEAAAPEGPNQQNGFHQ